MAADALPRINCFTLLFNMVRPFFRSSDTTLTNACRLRWHRSGAERVLQRRRYCFDFGVELDRLIAHFAAPAGLPVAAERQSRIAEIVGVDPDRAGLAALGEFVG